jgi:hypothetical protein
MRPKLKRKEIKYLCKNSTGILKRRKTETWVLSPKWSHTPEVFFL